MLLILVILFLSKSTIVAASTAPTSGLILAQQTSTPQVLCPYQHRTLWDIVKSCLITIFACSWVSVHPNVPPPNAKWWKVLWLRLELMIWAIIAPELVLWLAIRQWVGARRLARKNQDLKWTETHGHFYQMGGFRNFAGPSECPRMTESEIQDLSKADPLSKALVVAQTSWFVMQCIVRRIEGLYITELELATTAFAVLNGVMYFFWWNKPLAVQYSLRKQSSDEPETEETRLKAWEKNSAPTNPFYLLLHCLSHRNDSEDPESPFYGRDGSGADNGLATFLASVTATIFGGIHWAGLSLHFPSHTEWIIWRFSSIAITTIPLLTFLILFVIVIFPLEFVQKTFMIVLLALVTVVTIALYIIARLLLLIEVFTTLRELPLGAYEVVRWTTFIPHI